MGRTHVFTSWAGRALCVLGLAMALPVFAATIPIVPGTSMAMDPPEGQCRIEPSASQFDAGYFATMQQMYAGSNNLLALFIECDVLASVRQGMAQPITRWTIVLLPLSNGQVIPATGYTRAQVIEEMSKVAAGADLQGVLDGQKDSIEQRVGQVLQQDTFQMGQVRSLGLLARDDAALYSGLHLSQGMTGQMQNVACVIGMTVISNHIVTVNAYQPFEGAETYTDMVEDMQDAMADLVSMNGGHPSPPALPAAGDIPPMVPAMGMDASDGGGGGNMLMMIVLGAGVVLAGGLVGFFLTRRKPGDDT
ncbi:hypothetical protein [Emcibacter sp. SYSU 3D8]|uniref:hypothetical protein n=1 Tax=Emcibacter sp. SYSU 3D8 TaxID=3133969 RepID=UPI0031FEE671